MMGPRKQSASRIDLLFFAEDPGAANYISPLPYGVSREGLSCLVLAEGKAVDRFTADALPYLRPEDFGDARAILEKTRPRIIVVGTSENEKSLGLSLLDAAREAGIRSIGVVDAFMNAAHRFRGRGSEPLRHAPDWLFVPDTWTAQAFVDLGFPGERTVVCGHPQYDHVRMASEHLRGVDRTALRERFFLGLQQDRPVCLFAAEISDGLQPEQFLRSNDYSLHGRGDSDRRTDIVLEEWLDAISLLPETPQIALRLHPKNDPAEFAPYLSAFRWVSREEPVLELVYASDSVFGLTTSLLLEAAILGVPTFSIVPREAERLWLPSVRAGITPCATTREELRTLLPDFLRGLGEARKRPDPQLFPFGSIRRAVQSLRKVLCFQSVSGAPIASMDDKNVHSGKH
ncbi:MAG: hypothetical protein AB1512_06050 [Thermodesulfobacteriota bacterium]